MEKTIEHKKIIIGLLILGALIIGSTALAALVDWPPSPLGTVLDPSGEKTGEPSTLPILVKYLYEWAVGLGGLAAFIALIIAGFDYLTSTGDPAKMNSAKDRIIWAIGGLALLLGSWVILNIINPQLTTLRLPPLDMDEKIQDFSDCATANDCPDKLACVCSFPEELSGQLGVAGRECSVGYCSALGGEATSPLEHLCAKINVWTWYGGNDWAAVSLDKIGECKNITDVPGIPGNAIRAGGVIFTAAWDRNDQKCGIDHLGNWTPACEECSKTASPDACDLCCHSCHGRIILYHEQKCVSAFTEINAGDHYVDLSEDVYSVKFLPPYQAF